MIKSYGSSSNGNSILVNGNILLDAGVNPKKMKPRPKPEYVLVTHIHGDHSKYVKYWMDRGLKVYSTELEPSAFSKVVDIWDIIELGDATVQVLPAIHDTKNPCNFLIDIGENRILYEVDNAKQTYEVEGVTHYIAECNWDEATMARNIANGSSFIGHDDRLRATHKSLEILLEELEVMDKSCLKEVWLAHASANNLNKELAMLTVQEIVGVPVYFA